MTLSVDSATDSSKDLSYISDSELRKFEKHLQLALGQLKEVSNCVKTLSQSIETDRETAKSDPNAPSPKHGMTLLSAKVHLMLNYCSQLSLYIAMRAEGSQNGTHTHTHFF